MDTYDAKVDYNQLAWQKAQQRVADAYEEATYHDGRKFPRTMGDRKFLLELQVDNFHCFDCMEPTDGAYLNMRTGEFVCSACSESLGNWDFDRKTVFESLYHSGIVESLKDAQLAANKQISRDLADAMDKAMYSQLMDPNKYKPGS